MLHVQQKVATCRAMLMRVNAGLWAHTQELKQTARWPNPGRYPTVSLTPPQDQGGAQTVRRWRQDYAPQPCPAIALERAVCCRLLTASGGTRADPLGVFPRYHRDGTSPSAEGRLWTLKEQAKLVSGSLVPVCCCEATLNAAIRFAGRRCSAEWRERGSSIPGQEMDPDF